MSLNVQIFPANDPRHKATLDAFQDGVARSGDIPHIGAPDDDRGDVLVVFGMLKWAVKASHARGLAYQRFRAAGRPAVVIDSGYVHRNRYYMVGLNGLNGRADFNNAGASLDRWKMLDVQLAPWTTKGRNILVTGQVPWDASVQEADHMAWCRMTIDVLRSFADRPVVFRPHPLVEPSLYRTGGVKGEFNRETVAAALSDAYAVVTFNSNFAVDALICGVPAFAADRGSMAWDIAGKSLSSINSPVRMRRERWAGRLAYAQWTSDEMSKGLPWRHLRPAIVRQLEAA